MALKSKKNTKTPDPRPRLSYYLAAIVSFMTLAVYLPALRNGFVLLDDDLYVYDNPHIRSMDWTFFRWAFSDLSAGFWHPLTWISYAVDYALWDLNPVGYHLTAIILHAINTFLVVILVERLIEAAVRPTAQLTQLTFYGLPFSLIAAAVTGLLFGLHPLHVESVAWISERKDLLCGLFFLLSIITYTSFAEAVTKDRWYLNRHYRGTLALFIVALSAKTMAVTLPVVLLILDWYPMGRIRSIKDFVHSFIEKIPFIVSSILISLISYTAQKTTGALALMAVTPLHVRVLVAFRALMMYLWKMLIPIDLVPLYPYPQNVSLLSPEYLFAIALFVGITMLCVLTAREKKALLSLWAYYVVTLLPVLGIVQIGSFSMADRFTYLPGLGPFMFVGLAVARIGTQTGNGKVFQRFTAVAAIAIAVYLSYGTLRQITIWKSGVTLWSYFIDKEPRRFPEAYLNLGIALGQEGKFDQAIEAFDKAISIKPKLESAYLNRGSAFKRKGELELAIKDYSTALSVRPNYVEAFNDRGIVFNIQGQFDRAIEDFNAAIAIEPTAYPAYINRGISYKGIGELARAIQDYSKALSLNPDFANAYVGRADLYMIKGMIDLAVKDYQKACELGNETGCNRASVPFGP